MEKEKKQKEVNNLPELPDRLKAKMLRNVNAKKCCFNQYEGYELAQATDLRGGDKRFEIDKIYELKYERAEDWELVGWCAYVH